MVIFGGVEGVVVIVVVVELVVGVGGMIVGTSADGRRCPFFLKRLWRCLLSRYIFWPSGDWGW